MDCEYDDILRAQTGDREAFGQLIERHQDLVYAICYGMTAQSVDAEDLKHEAFVEAFLKLHTLRDATRFSPWLRTLTLNVCRMWHRDKKRESVAGLSDLLPRKEKMGREAQLSGYFARLSDSHRMALALHYWEGLSYEEMARFLEVPIGTVMSRLSRARDVLKDAMEQSEDIVIDGERDLQVEVDAEIEVLLKLFGDDMNSMGRLSVVLEKSPDRFRQVISQVEDGATVEQVALLVRHFGQPAVEATLGCYFDGDAEDRSKTFAVLLRLIEDWDDCPKPAKIWSLRPEANFVIDTVMQSAHPVDEQIELLVDLLDASRGDVVRIFACVLRGYGDRAFSVLMERYAALDHCNLQHCELVESLRLFGTRFCEALLDPLRSADPCQIWMGLRGVGGIIGNIYYASDGDKYAEYRYFDQRTVGLLLAPKLNAEVIGNMTRAVGGLINYEDRDIRLLAIDILKRLPAGSHLVEQEAQPLLVDMLDHPERSVQEAAVLALGNVGNEEARRKLRAMTSSDDRSGFWIWKDIEAQLGDIRCRRRRIFCYSVRDMCLWDQISDLILNWLRKWLCDLIGFMVRCSLCPMAFMARD